MSNTMSLCLLSLPTEILVDIISYLKPRHIAACKRTCRQLNHTIIHSQLLQYLIRIGKSGLYDPLLTDHTIPQRLEALEKWEEAWRILDFKSSCPTRRIVTCRSWGNYIGKCKIRDDFLMATTTWRPTVSPLLYSYVDLRASQPEGETDPWTKITNNDRGNCEKYILAFSVKQDLVLIGTRLTYKTPSMELDGISFSRGTPHPLAICASIWTGVIISDEDLPVQAAIVGDRAILHIVASAKSSKLYLYSWKDGHVFQLRKSREPAWSPHFTMISNDTIALINTHSVALELCKIVTDPESCEPSLCRLVRLGFPPLASNICIRWVDAVCPDTPCGAVEGRPPRRLPFQNSPEDGIAIFCINAVGPDDFDSLTIVTHLRTLLALATTTPPEGTFIPWKDWGPPVTACFEPTYFPLSHDLLAGERWVTPVLDSLCLRDFNFTRIQDSIRGTSDSAWRGAPTKVVNHRRVVPRGLFKGVASELPYMIVHGPAPRGLNIPALHEERAACICVDQEDGKQYVDIYST